MAGTHLHLPRAESGGVEGGLHLGFRAGGGLSRWRGSSGGRRGGGGGRWGWSRAGRLASPERMPGALAGKEAGRRMGRRRWEARAWKEEGD